MKKIVILSVLGLAAGVVSSYGQGSISFNTYTAQGGSGIPIYFGSVANSITTVDPTFTGQLYYSAVNIPDVATSGAVTQGSSLTPGWTLISSGTFIDGGFILAPDANITAAVGTTLYFEVVAFTGASYASGGYAGHSATFTATLATGTTLPNGNQLNNLQPFQAFNVVAVPEPTTLALAGLGGLASLVMLRRKNA